MVTVYDKNGYILSVAECFQKGEYNEDRIVDIVNEDARFKEKYSRYESDESKDDILFEGAEKFDISSAKAFAAFIDEFSIPFDARYSIKKSSLHESRGNVFYIYCQVGGSYSYSVKNGAEFEVDLKNGTVKEIARYNSNEYTSLSLSQFMSEEGDITVYYETDDICVYSERTGQFLDKLCVLYKKSGETVTVGEDSENYDWSEYEKTHPDFERNSEAVGMWILTESGMKGI